MEEREQEIAAVKQVSVRRMSDGECLAYEDVLSVEEPLEIRIRYWSEGVRTQRAVSVTMRTPGNDAELAAGFLFTEGIIDSCSRIRDIGHDPMECSLQKENVISVTLAEDVTPDLMQADRNFYTTSSCGVCGKGSIQAIRTVSPFRGVSRPERSVAADLFYQLPEKLRAAQDNFSATGGIHASGLFSHEGTLLAIREDVGRHNALDKLIGAALMEDLLPLCSHILLLSGRASFELIQKAAMAGIGIVAAIGAPSSLAVELAREFDITLLGFLKGKKFNIYHLSKDLQIEDII